MNSPPCDRDVFAHRRCCPAATTHQIPILSKTVSLDQEKIPLSASKMIWRRNPLGPATFLIIMMMKVFTGQTLTCHPAEYQIGNECCPMCPAGSRVKTDCTEFRSTSCLPCLDFTFMDKPTGRKECFHCTNCDPGLGLKVKTSCTTTSDTVCEPLEGFFCFDSTENNCAAAQKHSSCQPGQYINKTGTAFTDTVCSDCSAGTFSDGTFTSCQEHTQCESGNLQLIKAGTASSDAECGEESLNVPAAVIVPVLVVSLLISAALVYFFYFKKKKTRQKQGQRIPNVQEEENAYGKELSAFVALNTNLQDTSELK